MILLLLLVMTSAINAKDFIITNINTDKFPTLETAFLLTNDSGEILSDFKNTDFTIIENGKTIADKFVEVDCYTSQAPLQVVLMIDKSTSMNDIADGKSKMEWAKESAIEFINSLYLGDFSAVAITTFCTDVELVCSFTNDKTKLITAINSLSSITASTDFNVAFLDKNTGASALLKKQPNINRKVVFLTDGKHDTDWRGALKTSEIQYDLIRNDIELYSITFLEAPNNDLNAISVATGGYYYNIAIADKLPDLYKTIAKGLSLQSYCILTWISELYCQNNPRYTNVQIKYEPLNLTKQTNYTAPDWSVFDANFYKDYYYFGFPAPENSTESTIFLKPSPYDYNITDISLADNSYFEIIDYGDGTGIKPGAFTITAGTEHRIKVRFTQHTEDLARSTKLIINGYPCDSQVNLFGGKGKLIITNPTKADIISTCSNIEIKWDGVTPSTKTNLYYKEINDLQWQEIALQKTNLHYVWKAPTTDGQYLIKAISYLENGTGGTLEAISDTFTVITPHLTAQQEVLNHDTLLIGDTKNILFENIVINNTELPVRIENGYFTGNASNDFLLTEISRKYLQSGETSSVMIEFTPNGENIRQANLILVTDCGNDIFIPIDGYGICQAQARDTLDIGTTFVDVRKDSIFIGSFYNPMTYPIIFSTYISGKNRDEFYIANMYDGQKITLAPFGTFNIKMVLVPTSPGEKSAIINYAIEGCNASKSTVIGNGILKGLTINNLDFGRKLYKSTFDTLDISIINLDKYEVSINEMSFIRNNKGFGIEMPTLPYKMKARDTLSLPAYFTPNTKGSMFDTLQVITSNNDTLYCQMTGETYLPELYIETHCPLEIENNKTGIATLLLINPSATEDLRIDTCQIITGSNEFLEIDTLLLPRHTTINAGDSLLAYLEYAPKDGGQHYGEVLVWANNYDATHDTTSKANSAQFICDAIKFDYSDIIFGSSILCEKEISTFTVTNHSSGINLLLDMKQAKIIGNDKDAFEFLTDDFITIAGQETATINIQFTAEHEREHTAEVLIPTSTGEVINLYLSAFGTRYDILLNTELLIYEPNKRDKFIFSISIPETSKGYADNISFEITFEPSMLYVTEDDIKAMISDDINAAEYLTWDELSLDALYGKISGKATGRLLAGKKYDILQLGFFGLLPQKNSSLLEFQLDYSCGTEYEKTDAVVKIEDACLGDLRFVETSAYNFYCEHPYPNPAKNALILKYGVAYKTMAKISMFDIQGREVAVLFEQIIDGGNYQQSFALPEEISNGTYQLVFSSSTFSQSYSLVIAK